MGCRLGSRFAIANSASFCVIHHATLRIGFGAGAKTDGDGFAELGRGIKGKLAIAVPRIPIGAKCRSLK